MNMAATASSCQLTTRTEIIGPRYSYTFPVAGACGKSRYSWHHESRSPFCQGSTDFGSAAPPPPDVPVATARREYPIRWHGIDVIRRASFDQSCIQVHVAIQNA